MTRLEARFNSEINRLNIQNEQLKIKVANQEKEIGELKAKDAHRSKQSSERAIASPPPTSCSALAQLGNRNTGFYLIKDGQASNSIKTVYCDFSFATNDPSKIPINAFDF